MRPQKNLVFYGTLELLKHQLEFPKHTYSIGSDYNGLSTPQDFESVAAYFRRKYAFEFKLSLDYGEKRLYEKEYENLEERLNYFRRQVQEEERSLEGTLRENIWVSGQDSKEILMKYRSKNTDIYEIAAHLFEIRTMLEKPKIFDIELENPG